MFEKKKEEGVIVRENATSSLSSLALCPFGSLRNSLVILRHSWTFSGETKSIATFVHDCTTKERISIPNKGFTFWTTFSLFIPTSESSHLFYLQPFFYF